MTPVQQRLCWDTWKKSKKAREKEKAHCKKNLWRFVTGFVWSSDDRAPERGEHPKKPFPDYEYLRICAGVMEEHPFLIVEKSRQMMISWLFCARVLWRLVFYEGTKIYLQRQKEEKSRELIERVTYMAASLPKWMFDTPPVAQMLQYQVGTGTKVMGVAQGAGQVQGFVAAQIIEDEFQENEVAEDTITKVLPMTGSMHLVGTAQVGSYMAKMVTDAPGTPKTLYRGLTLRRGKGIWQILRLHYTARYDPATEEGQRWYTTERAKYADNETGWEQMYEINWLAAGGRRMFRDFKREVHVAQLEVNDFLPILRGWDFGYHYPMLVVGQINTKDQFCFLGEFTLPESELTTFLDKSLEWCHKKFGPAESRDYRDFCDPAGRCKSHRSQYSDVEVMMNRGIFPVYWTSSEVDRTAILRRLMLIRQDKEPGLLFDESCEILITGAAGAYVEDKNRPEEAKAIHPYVDAYDAAGYIVIHTYGSADEALRPFRPPNEEERFQEEQQEFEAEQEEMYSMTGDYTTGRY